MREDLRAPLGELPITEPRKLRAALRGLEARQQQMVELHHGLGQPQPQTLHQIARRFGISAEGVRQIEQQALHRLAKSDGMEAQRLSANKRASSAETGRRC